MGSKEILHELMVGKCHGTELEKSNGLSQTPFRHNKPLVERIAHAMHHIIACKPVMMINWSQMWLLPLPPPLHSFCEFLVQRKGTKFKIRTSFCKQAPNPPKFVEPDFSTYWVSFNSGTKLHKIGVGQISRL